MTQAKPTNPVIAKSSSRKGVRDWSVVAKLYSTGLIEVEFISLRVMVTKICFLQAHYPDSTYDQYVFIKQQCAICFEVFDALVNRLVDQVVQAIKEIVT